MNASVGTLVRQQGALAASGGGDPEDQLIERAQGGDRHAYEALYRQQVGRVYAICLRMVCDRERAEALTQDAFVRAWEKLPSYRGEGAFASWLGRLTSNVVIEDARRRSRHAGWFEQVTEEEMSALHGSEASAATGAQRWAQAATPPPDAEQAIDLERAIAGLPAGARTVFVLHDVQGYKYREIAALTAVAEGTVKAQLHRARRLLRKALGGIHGGEMA